MTARLVGIVVITSFTLYAQTEGPSIRGAVMDATGAAIPGARIVAQGALDRETVSDAQGRYEFLSLRPGAYTLTVDREGFEARQAALNLTGEPQVLDWTLQTARYLQSVTVTSMEGALEEFTKIPGTQHEIPRAISVIGSEEIRQRNFRHLPDLLPFLPGMTANSYRIGGYHFYARGYRMGPEDTRVDGFVGQQVSGGFGSSLFGIEQAVVLRGPASLLYGATSSPGGLIDLITKKPQEFRFTRVDVRTGAYAGRGLPLTSRPSVSFDVDSTGAVSRGGRILYRTLFTLENQRYFTNQVLDRNRYASAQLTFKLDPAGRYILTPIFQYARFNRPSGGGLVISPTTSLAANDGISGPIQTSDLSPLSVNHSAGGRIDETHQAGFDFRAAPSRDWRINLTYRNLRNDNFIDQYLAEAGSTAQQNLLRTQNLIQRTYSKSDTDRRYHNIDGNTSYELRGSTWKNFSQVGAYTRVTGIRGTTPLGPVPGPQSPINIYTGAVTAPLNPAYPVIQKGLFLTTTTWNGYFQNRTALFSDRLMFTLGLGYGQNHPGGQAVQKGDLQPNFAVLYNATSQIAVYWNYATSFNPIDPTLENALGRRGTFDATTGKSYEVGAKYQLPSRRLTGTLSLFNSEISNALVQTGITDVNINGNRFYIAAGSRRSKGAEISSDYRLTSNWFVTGAVSYTSGYYTGTGPASAAATLALPGSPTEKTPRWSWNARTTYQRSEGKLAGFGASLGFLWQDQRLGSNGARTLSAPDPLMLPAFSRTDASINYRLNERLDWALNVDNLFDRLIFVNATVGSAMEIAPPRAATMRISYRF